VTTHARLRQRHPAPFKGTDDSDVGDHGYWLRQFSDPLSGVLWGGVCEERANPTGGGATPHQFLVQSAHFDVAAFWMKYADRTKVERPMT
jgi:hypothetical protein